MITKNAFGNLKNRYKAVLKKCHLLNTFGSLALVASLVLGSGFCGASVAYGADFIIDDNIVDTDIDLKDFDNITTSPLTQDKEFTIIAPSINPFSGKTKIGTASSSGDLIVNLGTDINLNLENLEIQSGTAVSGANTSFILQEGSSITANTITLSGNYNDTDPNSIKESYAYLDTRNGTIDANSIFIGNASIMTVNAVNGDISGINLIDSTGKINLTDSSGGFAVLGISGDINLDTSSKLNDYVNLNKFGYLFVDGTTTISSDYLANPNIFNDTSYNHNDIIASGIATNYLIATPDSNNQFNINSAGLIVANAENGLGLDENTEINILDNSGLELGVYDDIFENDTIQSYGINFVTPGGTINSPINVKGINSGLSLYGGQWQLNQNINIDTSGKLTIAYNRVRANFNNINLNDGDIDVYTSSGSTNIENPYVNIQNFTTTGGTIYIDTDITNNTNPNASSLYIENFNDHADLNVQVDGNHSNIGSNLKLNHNFENGVLGTYNIQNGIMAINGLAIADNKLISTGATQGSINIANNGILVTDTLNIFKSTSNSAILNIDGAIVANRLDVTDIIRSDSSSAYTNLRLGENGAINPTTLTMTSDEADEGLYAERVNIVGGSTLTLTNQLDSKLTNETSSQVGIIDTNILNTGGNFNIDAGVWKMATDRAVETNSVSNIEQGAYFYANNMNVTGDASSQLNIKGTLDIQDTTMLDDLGNTVASFQSEADTQVNVVGGTLKAYQEALFSQVDANDPTDPSTPTLTARQDGIDGTIDFSGGATLFIKDDTTYKIQALDNMLNTLDSVYGDAYVAAKNVDIAGSNILVPNTNIVDITQLVSRNFNNLDFTLINNGDYSTVQYPDGNPVNISHKANKLVVETGNEINIGSGQVTLVGKGDNLTSYFDNTTEKLADITMEAGGSLALAGGSGSINDVDARAGTFSSDGVYSVNNLQIGTSPTNIKGTFTTNNITAIGSEVNLSGILTANDITTSAQTNINIGSDSLLSANTIDAGNTSLKIQGNLKATDIKTSDSEIHIEGALDTKDLETTNTNINVSGRLTTNTFNGNNTKLNIGSEDTTGTATAVKATNIKVFADPAWVNDLPASAVAFGSISGGTILHAGRNSHITVGTVDANWLPSQMTEAGLEISQNGIESAFGIYGQQLDLTTANNGGVLADNAASFNNNFTADNASFGSSSLLVVDAKAGASNPALVASNINVVDGAKLLISDVVLSSAGKATVHIAKDNDGITGTSSGSSSTYWGYNDSLASASKITAEQVDTSTLIFDNRFVVAEAISNDASGFIVQVAQLSSSTVFPKIDRHLVELIDKGYDNNVDSPGMRYIDYASFEANGDALIEGGAKLAVAGNSIQVLADISDINSGLLAKRTGFLKSSEYGLGMGSVTSDGNSMKISGLSSGSLENGLGLWINPMYRHTSSDGFKSGSFEYGYDSNLYGVTVGADYTINNSFRFGASMFMGSGDSESSGNFSKAENDFDYYGYNLYAGFMMGNLGLSADIGYTNTQNEIVQKSNIGTLTSKFDAEMFTTGLRAEYQFQLDNLKIIPHLGFRYNLYRVDDYNTAFGGATAFSTKVDNANIFAIPVGITFAGEYITASGIKINPKLDLGLQVTMGDLDAMQEIRIAGVDGSALMESEIFDPVTFVGGLGLGVEKDKFGFEVDYKINASSNVVSHGVFGSFIFKL